MLGHVNKTIDCGLRVVDIQGLACWPCDASADFGGSPQQQAEHELVLCRLAKSWVRIVPQGTQHYAWGGNCVEYSMLKLGPEFAL
jgi:hypothetical protein